MDDLAHDFHLNHRKRKADTDESQENVPSSDPVVQDTPSVPTLGPSTAPRQQWFPSGPEWPSPASQVSSPLATEVLFNTYPSNPTKRPRLDKIQTSLRSTKKSFSRKSPVKARPPPTLRHGSDIEDLGMVSMGDPGPSSGSLLRLRPTSKSTDSCPPSPTLPLFPVDTNSTHIPSLQPLISRQTLKELDLDVILRNPQLRHDLLFDPGLQFRPTCSRRKRGVSEKYWAAIVQEVETGCTCVSFDLHGKPHSVVCVCAQVPDLPPHPVVAYSSSLSVFTLRMPSRIHSLLSEFLEVLLLVIQPLSSVSGMYVNPNTFKSQMQEHSAQAAYIRSIFDPALIEQELTHELFDPSGLFFAIGLTLKGHCAPMRDRAIEVMVQVAQACAPGGTGSKRDAVTAVRMCMEILELMKLDIANHQLQTLRPFLIRTSGQFELKAFKNRKGGDCSLRMTREWLRLAHADMLTRVSIPHPQYPSGCLEYSTLPRNQQKYLAVLKGIVDLVFDPPPSSFSPPPSPSTPINQTPTATSSRLHGYPETSYLDSTRLVLLSADAADATAIYTFLLLYRQLVHSESCDTPSPQELSKVEHGDLIKLKNEIRDIASGRLGSCFSPSRSSVEVVSPRQKADKDRINREDIVLQIVMRANERRNCANVASSSPICEAPSERMVNLAQRWVDSNMQSGSSLSTMLRCRLRDVVFNAVVALAYPGRDSTTCNLSIVDFLSSVQTRPAFQIPLGTAMGMEPLTEEIRSLAEKVSRLALIHLNAFLPLYEQDGFLD